MIDKRICLAGGIVGIVLLNSCATYRLDPASSSELEERLQAVATFEYGQSRTPSETLSAVLAVHSTPSQRRSIEPHLIALAGDPSATRAGRQQVILTLGHVGTARSAPMLIQLLPDPELGDDAAIALQRISDPRVAPKVLKSLPSSSGIARERTLAILGAKRYTKAVSALAGDALVSDERVASAAVVALGCMARPEATAELIDALPQLTGRARDAAWPALLAGQEAALIAGDDQTASQVTRALAGATPPQHVLAASKRAELKAASPPQAEQGVSELLASTPSSLQSIGAELARQLLVDSQLLSVSQSLPSFPDASQIALLGILEDRHLSAAAPLIAERVSSPSEAVRCASIRALGQVGNVESLAVIAEATVAESETVREAAVASLRLISGPQIDVGLVDLARSADAGVQVEIFAAIGDRGMTNAVPVLFEAVHHADPAVRRTAIQELGALVGPTDWPRLLDLAGTVQTSEDRQALVRAAGEAGRRIPDRGEILASRLATTSNTQARAALLTLAGRLGDDATLAYLSTAAADADAEIRLPALRALGSWQTVAALPPLVAAASSTNEPSRRLAVRGALQVLRQAEAATDSERVDYYRAIAGHIENGADRRLLLSAVAELHHPAAGALAAESLDHPDVRAEAEAAVLGVTKQIPTLDDTLRAALERLAAESESEGNRKEATDLLNR